jgi:hypothetical protein
MLGSRPSLRWVTKSTFLNGLDLEIYTESGHKGDSEEQHDRRRSLFPCCVMPCQNLNLKIKNRGTMPWSASLSGRASLTTAKRPGLNAWPRFLRLPLLGKRRSSNLTGCGVSPICYVLGWVSRSVGVVWYPLRVLAKSLWRRWPWPRHRGSMPRMVVFLFRSVSF